MVGFETNQGRYMKRHAILNVMVVAILSMNYSIADESVQNCSFVTGANNPQQFNEQLECLKSSCLIEIKERLILENNNEVEDTEQESGEIEVSDLDLNNCVEQKFSNLYSKSSKQTKDKIQYLKKHLSSTEELNLLIDLLKIEEKGLKEIENVLIKNVQFWDEVVVNHITKENIFLKKPFITYLTKNVEYKDMHKSAVFAPLLEKDTQSINDFIVEKGLITEAILKLPINNELVEIVLNDIESERFTQKYLSYSKEMILTVPTLMSHFVSILNTKGQNKNATKIRTAFINTFKDGFNNQLWRYFVIFSDAPKESFFKSIDLVKRTNDIEYIIRFYTVNNYNNLIILLENLIGLDKDFFNNQFKFVVNSAVNNELQNHVILKLIHSNIDSIDKKTVLTFIENSSIDFDNPLNIFYLNKVTKDTLSEEAYFNYIINQFEINKKTDLLVYASYHVTHARLLEILNIMKKNNINLISNLNIDLIKNIDSWVQITKECIESKCSLSKELYGIGRSEIYNTFFKYGNIPQMLTAIANIKNISNNISFSRDDINTFLDTLKNRGNQARLKVATLQLQNILKQANLTVTNITESPIDIAISLENIKYKINQLKRYIPFTKKTDINTENLTKTLIQLEERLSNVDEKEEGVALQEFYDLVSLLKVSIERDVVTKTKEKSILSALQYIHNRDFSNPWALSYLNENVSHFNNLVMPITSVNKALYSASLTKYALASADESKLKELSYEEIDTLGKLINYQNSLPHKLFANTEELVYEEILKEYFLNIKSYYSTLKNTQVNIPLTCETGQTCIFEMKFEKNIGSLTSIGTTVQAINFENLGLKVYKNRDLNIIGSLNDVLFINSSVAKGIIPDQRPRAADGIPPVIKSRRRYQTVCLFRVKFGFGSVCGKKKKYPIDDEYVAVYGVTPRDGLDGFAGANSSKITLSLFKSSKSKFARVLILNNTGAGGKQQIGGKWLIPQNIGSGRGSSGGDELDVSAGGFGFSFGSPGKGHRVSRSEAIPDYKDNGADGMPGQTGEHAAIELKQDASSFSLLSIGKQPK